MATLNESAGELQRMSRVIRESWQRYKSAMDDFEKMDVARKFYEEVFGTPPPDGFTSPLIMDYTAYSLQVRINSTYNPEGVPEIVRSRHKTCMDVWNRRLEIIAVNERIDIAYRTLSNGEVSPIRARYLLDKIAELCNETPDFVFSEEEQTPVRVSNARSVKLAKKPKSKGKLRKEEKEKQYLEWIAQGGKKIEVEGHWETLPSGKKVWHEPYWYALRPKNLKK